MRQVLVLPLLFGITTLVNANEQASSGLFTQPCLEVLQTKTKLAQLYQQTVSKALFNGDVSIDVYHQFMSKKDIEYQRFLHNLRFRCGSQQLNFYQGFVQSVNDTFAKPNNPNDLDSLFD